VSQAVAASATAFVFPAAVALWFLWRNRTYTRSAAALMLSAVPGAALGASSVHHLDARILLALVAGLMLLSGVHSLRSLRRRDAPSARPELPMGTFAGIGILVGAGSALTGTGGPVLLAPLLVLMRQPLKTVIVGVNAIQMPVAISATLVHWRAGALDARLACTVGFLLLIASTAGQLVARSMPIRKMQALLSVLLLLMGGGLAWSLLPS
jgi:uncharacterized membrane protein YfcA